MQATPTSAVPEQRGHGVSYLIGKAWLGAFGWKVEGGAPAVRKAVVVAAPHTTNWDLPFTLATAYVLGVRIRWAGKHTLFKPPFGFLLRWLGGLPIDRRGRHNAVAATAEILDQHEDLLLVVPPEGTRKKSDRWKTGFYYIAIGAKVPVILGYLDYAKKQSGLGHVFYPTGDLEADAAAIRAFYADIRGKFPELESDIVFKVDDEKAAAAPPPA
jgi:1-acyl-sn-glycerol-3-phosphate acyltransferase